MSILISILSCAPLGLKSGNLQTIDDTIQHPITVDYSDFSNIFKKTGCQGFQSHVWNYIYKIVSIENGKPPPYHTVKEKIIKRIHELTKDHPASEEDIKQFAMRFVEVYALVTEFMDQNREEATDTLVHLEYGIVEPNHTEFIEKLRATFAELDRIAKALNQECQEESPTYASEERSVLREPSSDSNDKWDIRWFHTMRKNLHPLVYGARKVMSTAYQSCSVLDLPLMSLDHSTEGIYTTSRHSSGNGWRRAISNLNAVNQSHYYLSQMSIPNTNQCLNIYQSPLIYDYGGKPSTTLHSINLFRNSGSGSRSLGVDCSGFVASAMASAGLRLKPRVFIRPIHVKSVNSWMFKNARRNNLSCLQQQDISAENPIRPGDIIASNTHVVIVESTGPDPFGLSNVRSSGECHSRKIKLGQLDFSIIQSSAHNGGVGINRMHVRLAADGLAGIERGLKRSVSRACYKMFGMEEHTNINEVSILRHASGEPACRDREIYLESQECLSNCEPQYIIL